MNHFTDFTIYGNNRSDDESSREREEKRGFEKWMQKTQNDANAQRTNQQLSIDRAKTTAESKVIPSARSAEQFERVYSKIQTPPSYTQIKQVITTPNTVPQSKSKYTDQASKDAPSPSALPTKPPLFAQSGVNQTPDMFEDTLEDKNKQNDDTQAEPDIQENTSTEPEPETSQEDEHTEKKHKKIALADTSPNTDLSHLPSSLNLTNMLLSSLPENKESESKEAGPSHSRANKHLPPLELNPEEDQDGGHSGQSDQEDQQSTFNNQVPSLKEASQQSKHQRMEIEEDAEKGRFIPIDSIDLQEQADIAKKLFSENGAFDRLIKSTIRFCTDPAIQSNGTFEMRIPLDQKIFPETTLTMYVFPDNLELRFETMNTNSQNLLISYKEILSTMIQDFLNETNYKRSVSINTNFS